MMIDSSEKAKFVYQPLYLLRQNQKRVIIMKKEIVLIHTFLVIAITTAIILGVYSFAAAHCDTLDGPVIQDARKALETKDVTPVLKWVKQKDEKAVRAEFAKALSAKGKKNADAAENQFFASLVKIHRAGEGAPFTGLKPADTVEPVIAAADTSLISGSNEEVMKLVTDEVTKGIRERHHQAAELYKHKDESVEAGRKYVKTYVEYTHYVEKLQQDAIGHAEHHKEPAEKKSMKHHEH